MAKNQNYTVVYKRKRNGKTDYKNRLKLVMSNKPRVVIRKSNKHVLLQVIEYKKEGDTVLVSAHSRELAKLGWKCGTGNISSAYLIGMVLGKKMKSKNISEAVVDLGLQTSAKKGVLYSAVKGICDVSVSVPCSKEVFPDEKRIKGEHIAKYAVDLKKNKELFEKRFAKYLKQGLDPEKIPEHFDVVKKGIEGKK